MSPSRPIRQTNLKDSVASHVRDLILSGTWRPGTRLDQDQLAEDLGVSKLPIREALIQLSTEGLVVSQARRGSYVAPLGPEDIRDHYRIYGLASGLAAERAAERLTDDELSELRELLTDMDAEQDVQRLESLNVDFHRRLNRAGGSGRLLAVLRVLANSLPERFYEFAPGWSDEAKKHHWEILNALDARDGKLAGDLTARHLAAGADYAVKIFEGHGYWTDGSEG